jgi:uncharacterized protein (TIGR02145 family)
MKKNTLTLILAVLSVTLFSQTDQIVVTILNSQPVTGITNIQYEFSGTYLFYDISAEVSFNGNPYQPIPEADLSGDLNDVAPGVRNITWNGAASFPNQYSVQTIVRITATPNFTCGDQITDVEGNLYNTVLIGTQCWMKENLNIGTMVSLALDQTNNSVIEKYCYSNLESNCDIYGGLYQWDEMMQYTTQESTQGICPSGWHVPSDAEWTTMTDYVRSQPAYCCGSNTFNIGKALASTTLWYGPSVYPCGIANDPGTNNGTGFTGLPGGTRTFTTQIPPQPRFYYLTTLGYWWTSTAAGDTDAWGRSLYWDRAGIGSPNAVKGTGFSVRCLKDQD